jgi:hypothetical protein
MRYYTPAMSSRALIAIFLNFAHQLKFRYLFLVVIGLFFFNLLIPDFIPLIDETMLGLLAIVLASYVCLFYIIFVVVVYFLKVFYNVSDNYFNDHEAWLKYIERLVRDESPHYCWRYY